MTEKRAFPVFKSVVLGRHATHVAYLEALRAAQIKIFPGVPPTLEKMPIAKAEMTLDLVVVSVGDLGFTERTSYADICERGVLEFDLRRCPAEVGPALRLAYMGQPVEEVLYIAMGWIRRWDEYDNAHSEIFCVGHTGKENVDRRECGLEPIDDLYLTTQGTTGGPNFLPRSRWVFTLPTKQYFDIDFISR